MKTLLLFPLVTVFLFVSTINILGQNRQQDSLALVALYNATDGVNWTNATNWPNGGPINNWAGVILDDNGRVNEVNLSGNNLTGTLPAAIGNLNMLYELNLSSNNLRNSVPFEITNIPTLNILNLSNNELSGDLPDMSAMPQLRRLYIGNNLFTFENINNSGLVPGDISIFSYATQDTLLEITHVVETGTLTVIDGEFAGNEYSWYKNENLIEEDTRTITAPGNGDYYCEINNPLYPALTLYSDDYTVTYTRYTDSLALVMLYNATNGDNWTNKTGWLGTGNFSTWFGITVDTNNRITAINLNNNNLTGTLPTEVANLSHLTSLNIKNNLLTGNLPPLSRITTLTNLEVEDNKFVFANLSASGLVPNSAIASPPINAPLTAIGPTLNFTYDPQDTLLHLNYNEYAGTITVNDGEDTFNIYEWFVDESLSAEYSTRSILAKDNGSYNCAVTNLHFPDLTLDTDTVDFAFSIKTDSLALVHLYNETDGANWVDKSNWLSGKVSTWKGIKVVDNRVTEIDLHSNNLKGIIPFELCNLHNLSYLNLSDNGLNSAIPVELTSLIDLAVLKLNNNQLSGNIPDDIGNLTELSNLRLDKNLLEGNIPISICSLTELTYLNLSHNKLVGNIPSGINALTNLYWLSLSNNLLSGNIPSSIGSITGLDGLELDNNNLDGNIPGEFINLVNITDLSLNNNKLSGSLPTFWNSLSQLNYLSLGNNLFTGFIPSSIGNLTNLNQLDLQYNQFEGNIPSNLQFLTSLSSLNLNNNLLSGNIPVGLSQLVNLNTLTLDSNLLQGSIPSLSPLTNLYKLSLLNNLFTFSDLINSDLIPASINDFKYSPQDTVFALSEDIVNGTLTVIDDDENGNEYAWYKNEILTSETSNTIYMNSEGKYNCLVTNPLFPDLTLYSDTFHYVYTLSTDSIALVKLFESTGGETEWLSANGWLNERIDKWEGIDTLNQRVVSINLGGNNLIGNLPVEIGNLTQLTSLNLINNGITGNLPAEIGNLIHLTNLSLTNNNIEGLIPAEIGNLNSLLTLSLNGNLLEGSIPSTIGQLTSLEYLYLSLNSLSGTIPTEIGALTKLKTLNLSSNNFSGELPAEMEALTNLLHLYITNNEFEGSIPAGFSDFDLLRTFNIDNNRYHFVDIEPIFNWSNYPFSSSFLYSPQAQIGKTQTLSAVIGAPLQISINGYVAGDNDVFKWYKDGNLLPNETNASILIPSFTVNNEGVYHCVVTNTIATSLTLTSKLITVISGTVPETLTLSNETFGNGLDQCFGALDNIVVAGNSTTVNLLSGSSTTLVAGNTITFLPGFHAYPGSYANAYITTNGSFCSPNPAIVATENQPLIKSIELPQEEQYETDNSILKSVKVYPNPSNGKINIELRHYTKAVQITVFNMRGSVIYPTQTINSNHFEINLLDQITGIYLIRISDGETNITKKIMIN